MGLLGIDPATRCGFAFTPTNRLSDARTGAWRVRGTQHTPASLAAAHARSLAEFLDENPVDYCLLEKPVGIVMKSVTTQNMLWALHGGLVSVLSLRGIPYRTVQPNEWRSGVFGNGRIASGEAKRLAIENADREGIDIASHDEAEAFAILCYLTGHLRRWQFEDRAAA